MTKHFTILLCIGLAFWGCENSYNPDNLIQITTHRIKPSMKKVYEDLIENEFAIANRDYRLEDPDEQNLHSIAMKSLKVFCLNLSLPLICQSFPFSPPPLT